MIRMTFFNWVDFFVNPYNIFMLGWFVFLFTFLITGGILYLFGVERRLGLKIARRAAILAGTLAWVAGYGLVFWYNTPLGPALELVE